MVIAVFPTKTTNFRATYFKFYISIYIYILINIKNKHIINKNTLINYKNINPYKNYLKIKMDDYKIKYRLYFYSNFTFNTLIN